MMTKEHGRDLEKMWTAGYKYSWRKMEATAQNRASRWRRVVSGTTRLKSTAGVAKRASVRLVIRGRGFDSHKLVRPLAHAGLCHQAV